MKRKKVLLLLIVFVLLVNFVSADQVFQFEEDIDFKIPCFKNDGQFCSSSATCNITILDPNFLNVINGSLMTNKGTFHSISLTSDQLSEKGKYQTIIECQDGGEYGSFSEMFLISPIGSEQDDFGFLWIVVIIPLIIGFFSLMGSFFLGDDHKELKVGLFLFSFVTFFASMWLSYIVVSIAYSNMTVLQNALGTITWVYGIIITVVIVYFMMYILYKAFRQSAQEERDKDIEY